MRGNITCKRREVLNIPSVITAENEEQEEKLNILRTEFKNAYKKKEEEVRKEAKEQNRKMKQDRSQVEIVPDNEQFDKK